MITRYRPAWLLTDSFRNEGRGRAGMLPDSFGEYVKYVEYEKLLAEVKHLRAKPERVGDRK